MGGYPEVDQQKKKIILISLRNERESNPYVICSKTSSPLLNVLQIILCNKDKGKDDFMVDRTNKMMMAWQSRKKNVQSSSEGISIHIRRWFIY